RKSVEWFVQCVMWEKQNFEAFESLLRWVLENLPSYDVVVRPHPSERGDYWYNLLNGVARAHVVERTDPHPWIRGSELVVHTGCTTGLEAAVLGAPAVNLLPSDHPSWDRIVTYINPTFRDWSSAAQAISRFFVDGGGPIREREGDYQVALRKHLPRLGDASALNRTGDSVVALLKARGVAPDPQYCFKPKSEPLVTPDRSEVFKQKFTVSAEEMRDSLRDAPNHVEATPEPTMTVLDDSLFLLQPR
ncbi:MAG: hypothetical protein RLN70_02665, partial [Rhodospirillaceae bacterium]